MQRAYHDEELLCVLLVSWAPHKATNGTYKDIEVWIVSKRC